MITINESNFDKLISTNELVLLDFWAAWCPPCVALNPILNNIQQQRPDVVIGKANLDENQELAEKYKVPAIPYLLVFLNGNHVETMVGLQSEASILDKLSSVKPALQTPLTVL